MSHIDRRRLLKALAIGTAAATVPQEMAKAASAAAKSGAVREWTKRSLGWLIAQQRRERLAESTIDFWSMPWADISYDNHLPPQIASGMVSYEVFPETDNPAQNAIGVFTGDDENFRGWFDLRQLDRYLADRDGNETFSSMLNAFLGQTSAATRTALLAIDSSSPGPGQSWMEALPAFAQCYGSLIGISHFEQRGLRQQRDYLERQFSEDYFDCTFMEPASLCDAVIVTSAGLVETDVGFCPSESTEHLVGEMVRRLGHALLEQKILDRIVRVGETTPKPRFFALSSATLNAPSEPLLHLEMMLNRQSAFLSGSFAPLAVQDLPLFIFTSEEYDSNLRGGARDVLARAAAISGYALGPDMFATVQAPRYETETRRPGCLDIIALWPFKVDG